MFRQGTKKRFSIGEKIRYFDLICKNPLLSEKKKFDFRRKYKNIYKKTPPLSVWRNVA